MVRRELEIDEETDRLLTELASEYEGNLSWALSDLVHAREGIEDLAAKRSCIRSDAAPLRDRSEADFREGCTLFIGAMLGAAVGHVVDWEAMKARNGL